MNFSFSLYFMGDLAQLNCPGQVREILINQRGGNQQTVYYISGVYSFGFRRQCGNLSSITFFLLAQFARQLLHTKPTTVQHNKIVR